MSNRIHDIFEARGIKVASFARENNITPSTLYAIHDGTTKFEKIGINTFMKIAHGLGMTAEELYYGTPPKPPSFSDPRQTALNGYYECMNDAGRKLAVDSIRAMSAAPELRMVKDGTEHPAYKAAMGA